MTHLDPTIMRVPPSRRLERILAQKEEELAELVTYEQSVRAQYSLLYKTQAEIRKLQKETSSLAKSIELLNEQN